jgi:hypothetical protein
MPEQIRSIAEIKAQAERDFSSDRSIADCPYKDEPEAATIWRAEYVALSNQAWGRVAE